MGMKYLRSWPYYIIAACIVGFACFAVLFWLFDSSYKESLSTAITAGTAGLFAEIARRYFVDKQKRKEQRL